MKGNCHQVTHLTMQALTNSAGFDPMGIETTWPEMRVSLSHPRVALADDFASLLADLTLNMVLEHARRNLVLQRGYPRRQVLLLSDLKDRFIHDFRYDLQNFEDLKKPEVAFPGRDAMIARSPFTLTAVIQLKRCLEDEEWKVTDRFQGGNIPPSPFPALEHSPLEPSGPSSLPRPSRLPFLETGFSSNLGTVVVVGVVVT